MKDLLNNITNLFKVKTLITLATCGLFVYLAIKQILPVETTAMVIGMVFTYYFNKDKNKEN